jgi:adenine nucleotide transporter 17
MSQTQEKAQQKLAESTLPLPHSTAAQQSDNVAHALAGAGGGLLSMALTYPLITLSTRAQVESKRAQSSTLNAARRIIKREGLAGLYAGLDSALFGITVTNFVYYYWYEWTRSFFEKAALKAGRASSKLTTVESMLAGALAGSATVLLTNPIWVINTRMTTRKSESDEQVLPGSTPAAKAPSTLGTLLALVRDEGFGRLFAGVMPALVLVINPILQYTVFEQLKNALEKKRRVTPKDAFYLGALGKLLATSITYPYITVKSRMHVAGKDGPRESMLTTFKRIISEEGYKGLYGGKLLHSHYYRRILTPPQASAPRSPRASSPPPSCSPSRTSSTPTPCRHARSSLASRLPLARRWSGGIEDGTRGRVGISSVKC